jgi:hypothetical protein
MSSISGNHLVYFQIQGTNGPTLGSKKLKKMTLSRVIDNKRITLTGEDLWKALNLQVGGNALLLIILLPSTSSVTVVVCGCDMCTDY